MNITHSIINPTLGKKILINHTGIFTASINNNCFQVGLYIKDAAISMNVVDTIDITNESA